MKLLNSFKDLPTSYWIASTQETNYPTLNEDIDVDIAIIGGGMVGIMTAYMLTKAGRKVTILEMGRIASSTSGNTTAKITSQHSLIYDKLIDKKGLDSAKIYATSQEWAIGFIKDTIKELNIDCDFEEKSAYVFTQDEGYLEAIKNEVEAAKRVGIDANFVTDLDLPFNILGAVEFKGQAQFHPRKYLLAISDYIVTHGGKIYENTLVKNINRGEKITLTTKDDKKVIANKVVVASQYPFDDTIGFYFAKLVQERSYIIAAKIKRNYPNGMYISAEKPTRSLRSHRSEGEELLLVAGEHHKTGHEENIEHYKKLLDFANKYYEIEEVPYWWSAQDVHTIDDTPYIGNITRSSENVFVATGFKKWGMTNSHVAAKLISDSIIGEVNPWLRLYCPYRNIDGTSILKLVEQNLQVARDLIRSKTKDTSRDFDLKIGEGKVIEFNGEKIGAYLHDDGKVYFVDTTCTHLGCELVFNKSEKSWDCPCHGSRFDYKGNIIQGPATKELN